MTSGPLVETISASDGTVYVEEGQCGHGVRTCLVAVTMAAASHSLWVKVDSHRGGRGGAHRSPEIQTPRRGQVTCSGASVLRVQVGSVVGRQFELFFAAASAASFSCCRTTLIMFVGARFPS